MGKKKNNNRKPISIEAVSDFFRQTGLTGKTPVTQITGERAWIKHDEQGNEFIHREINEPRRKQGISDTELLKLIIECLDQDQFLDKQSGKIIFTRISNYLKGKDNRSTAQWQNTERNYRERVKKLLPYIIGVIKYNGEFYYKKSKFYNPPSK